MTARPGRTRAILYHHTHWDREWWATREEFRYWLVQVIDALIGHFERDPDLGTFVLDGQMIALTDYLELRPGQRERLVRLIRDGRIHVGPWYVLADEVLVSGEACIRNLWLGERTARHLGVHVMRVGYLPDQFGHTGQMPQILRGFGIDSAVVWRGFSAPPLAEDPGDGAGAVDASAAVLPPAAAAAGRDRRRPAAMQSEFWWEAPDGSRVLGIYLSSEYSQRLVRARPFEPEISPERAIDGFRRLVDCLRAYATTDCVLIPYGGDHLPADPRLPELVATLNTSLGGEGIDVEIGSLTRYVDEVRRAGTEPRVVWHGEARVPGGRANVLPGVLSARLPQKRANSDAQVVLERYAEPLQALAWLLGERYEAAGLWHSWEGLVQNHTHDSITGCSIDLVHREVAMRIAISRQLADILAVRAHEALAMHVDTSDLPAGATGMVVFNPLAASRTDAVRVFVERSHGIEAGDWCLLDPDGTRVPFQVRAVSARRPGRPTTDWLELTFVARDVPGLGYRRYAIARRDTAQPAPRTAAYSVTGSVLRSHAASSSLVLGSWQLANEYLAVRADQRNGSLTVTDLRTGQVYPGLNVLVDGGDAGDTYGYSWPLADREVSTRDVAPTIEWLESGPARATLRLAWRLHIPAGLTMDRLARSTEEVVVNVHSDVSLSPGVPRVDIRTHIANTACDHRLRALFPLGMPVERSWAEGPFEVVERPAAEDDGEAGRTELMGRERPQQSFVSVSDQGRGLTIANRGLPEFALLDDAHGTIALTLIRAVGYLSRDDLLTRRGRAGPPIETPDAQLQGPVDVEYAIIPHAGDWQASASYVEAHALCAPMVSAFRPAIPPALDLGRGNAASERRVPLPREGSLVSVAGDVVVTALKRGEDEPVLILRLLRLGDTAAVARVFTAHPMVGAHRVDLRERPLPDGDLERDASGAWIVDVGPWQLVTLALEPQTAGSVA